MLRIVELYEGIMHLLSTLSGGSWAARVGGSVVVPVGRPGFGSPSWRISGSAPQAELGATRSTTRLICARYAERSTNKAWEADLRILAWTRRHMSPCSKRAHGHGGALKRWCAGIHVEQGCRWTLRLTSHGRELNGGWAGSRGLPWIESCV